MYIKKLFITTVVIVLTLCVFVYLYMYYHKPRRSELNSLDLSSVYNTAYYNLLARNPQDISSDFLFVIHPRNGEKHKEEAIGWLKGDNYIIISALADLKR